MPTPRTPCSAHEPCALPEAGADPRPARPVTTAQDVLHAVGTNHIWLNAFKCIDPTPQFCEQLGRDILAMLAQRDNLLPKYVPDLADQRPGVQQALADMAELTPVLYLSINKS